MAAQVSLGKKVLMLGVAALLVITACVQLPGTRNVSQPPADEAVAQAEDQVTATVDANAETEVQSTDESAATAAALLDLARQNPQPLAVEAGTAQAEARLAEPEPANEAPSALATATVAGIDATTAMPGMPAPAAKVQEALIMQTADSVFMQHVSQLCTQIGNKLGSVSVEDCMLQGFDFGGGYSIKQRPLVIKEVAPAHRNDRNFRVFLMGGIHGDEYSSISIIFKWLQLFSSTATEGEFYWRIAPLVNPDGLLDTGQARRQNANGVDLNRNFPSLDWNDSAAAYWQENTGSNPRRFPGSSAASEPEVKWVVDQIEEFDPDVIVSIHAPYHLLDFDGPAEAPHQIGELYLHQLGVYPGSLGNYAGLNKRIPVVTLELPSAGILPPKEQIRLMWIDLVAWLDTEGRKVLVN